MTEPMQKVPQLETLYHQFLETENAAEFVRAISCRYTFPTLIRLAQAGRYTARRAAVMAISYLGDYRHNAVLGMALHDVDRGVRLLADNGIRDLWCRDGNQLQQQELRQLMRLNTAGLYEECMPQASEFVKDAPWYAEGWNQRAIALFAQKSFELSASDCHQALEINPYHFGAAVGMAHCYLEMDDPFTALECFRRALKLNPDLSEVRVQVDYLQRTLEGK